MVPLRSDSVFVYRWIKHDANGMMKKGEIQARGMTIMNPYNRRRKRIRFVRPGYR